MTGSVDISIAQDSPADIGALMALRAAWHPQSPDTAIDTNAAFPLAFTAEFTGEFTGEFTADFTGEFTAWLAKEWHRRVFWIARRGTMHIGMVNLVLFDRMPVPGRPSSGWGYLSNMFVVEQERNRGIGGPMADMVQLHADTTGLERIVLNPSKRSIAFYNRQGFNADNGLLIRQRP